MIINVAMTGAVPTKVDNPTVPMTVAEIVDDVLECADAGATAFHVHVRDEQGAPVHDRSQYEAVFGAVRAKAPELVLCVTTSSRVGGRIDQRMLGLDLEPECRPDLASLTLGSSNFPTRPNVNPPDEMVALLERMREQGIRPELEVFELGWLNTLHALRARELIPDPPLVNILLGSMGSTPAFVGDLATIVGRLPAGAEWAAAGIGMFQRPMVIAAAVMGGNVRTGLEDNPRGHDVPGAHEGATEPWTNAAAVRFAAEAARLAGRTVATPAETRARFGLDPR
jgi:uncharacterized protein (DUF849 family)